MKQYYTIAGLKIEMDTWGKTALQAEPYRCPPVEKADMLVEGQAEAMQQRAPYLPMDSCEYLSTGGSFYRQLLDFDGMLLHASAVMIEGKAYLFTAPSGTGKSTHTKLWLQVFGDKAAILNDDKPALRLEEGIWYAYGTPWSGKTDRSINAKVPLAGICVLTRGEENVIAPYTGVKAIHDILEQTKRSANARFMEKLLNLMDRLVSTVPIWKLQCNMDPQAAVVSYTAMSGGKKEN